jgi:hypothetical protein
MELAYGTNDYQWYSQFQETSEAEFGHDLATSSTNGQWSYLHPTDFPTMYYEPDTFYWLRVKCIDDQIIHEHWDTDPYVEGNTPALVMSVVLTSAALKAEYGQGSGALGFGLGPWEPQNEYHYLEYLYLEPLEPLPPPPPPPPPPPSGIEISVTSTVPNSLESASLKLYTTNTGLPGFWEPDGAGSVMRFSADLHGDPWVFTPDWFPPGRYWIGLENVTASGEVWTVKVEPMPAVPAGGENDVASAPWPFANTPRYVGPWTSTGAVGTVNTKRFFDIV